MSGIRPDQPEFRAGMLAEAIRQAAALTGEINPGALHAHLMAWAGLSEEECGGDIYATLFFMVRLGILRTNTPGTLGGDTRFTVSRLMTLHLYREADDDA